MVFLAQLVRKYPAWIVAAIVLLTAVFAYGATRVTISSDIQNFFSEDDPRLAAFNRANDTFGGSDYVIAATAADDVFTVDGLGALDHLTRALEAVPGVADVRSLTNMDHIQGTLWGIEVTDMLERPPVSAAEAEGFRARVAANERMTSAFVSKDMKNALILIQIEDGAKPDQVVRAIVETTEAASGGLPVLLTGTPLLTEAINDALRLDLLRLFPLVIVLILTLLYLSFRSWQGVLLPLGTVVFSAVWTIGLMGFLRVPLSQISAILPVILISVGSAYGIHVLHRYRDERLRADDGLGAVDRTVESVGLAVVLAGVTTMAGFLSNGFGSIVRIREFGLFTGFGVAAALIISLLFIPAVLTLAGNPVLPVARPRHRRSPGQKDVTPIPPAAPSRGNSNPERRASWLGRVAEAVIRRPAVVVVATLIAAGAAAGGVGLLETDTNFINFFDKGTGPQQAYELVQDAFSGVDSIQIVFAGEVLEPEVLRAMEALQDDLAGVPQLGRAMSIVDVIKEVGQALNDDDPVYARIPDTRPAVAQYLLLMSMGGGSALDPLLSVDQREAKIEIPVAAASSKQQRALLAHVEAQAQAHLGDLGEVTVTGMPYLVEAMADLIREGQIQSLILALVTVFVIVWLLVGSFVGGLITLAPTALTVLIIFGVMGWGGIPFDIVTALVSSIAIGIGIDYSIHVFTRFREGLSRGRSTAEAIRDMAAGTGNAVLINAGAVALGFLVLLFSAFPPLRTFGALIAVTMVVSSVSALTVLPALILLVPRRMFATQRTAGGKGRALG